jgi:hypothetical protein
MLNASHDALEVDSGLRRNDDPLRNRVGANPARQASLFNIRT